MRWALDAAYLAALGVSSPYWVYQSIKTGKYRSGLAERFWGSTPSRVDADRTDVWIHAVSVGEALAAAPLVRRLQSDRPDLAVALSTTTDAGLAVARTRFPDLCVFRAPLDFSWSVDSVYESLRPRALVLVERELWPNLLLEARRRGVPVAVVNARLGDRSHRRYRRVRRLLRPALEAVGWWGAQTPEDAARIADLCGPGGSPVSVTGSMKYDGAQTDRDNPRTAALRRLLAVGPEDRVFVAGSTHDPEESILLNLWPELRRMDDRLRLTLVPRHVHRCDAIAREIRRRGLRCRLRSELSTAPPDPGSVTLFDVVGELDALWGLAAVGYVGGSLHARRGGQSMVEPAAYGVPVCFGPNTWNFSSTVADLLRCGGARQVADAMELREALVDWVRRPDAAQSAGERARVFVAGQLGAVDRTLHGLASLLPPRGGHEAPRDPSAPIGRFSGKIPICQARPEM